MAPDHVMALAFYGLLQQEITKDYMEAERMMLKAIRINPAHCDSLSHYATFLGKVHNNYAAATVLYDRVLALDPLHVNTICNKGLVLQVPSDISICTYTDIDIYISCPRPRFYRCIYTHTHTHTHYIL